jgi:hypothetical protein
VFSFHFLSYGLRSRPRPRVNRHDHSRIIQPHRTSFVHAHQELAIEVQKKMLEYATEMFNGPPATRPANNPPTAPQNTSEAAGPPQKQGQVELQTEMGLPIMPAVVDNRELKKDYMVDLVRKYLTAHYG